jgi:hypothetical protein
LDQLLKVKEPWDREVDVVRNRSVPVEISLAGFCVRVPFRRLRGDDAAPVVEDGKGTGS